MKAFIPLFLTAILFAAACKKESNNTPSPYVLNTFEKNKVYNITKEITRITADSVRVLNYDSLGFLDNMFIGFVDSGMIYTTSGQLPNPGTYAYSAYHISGNQLSVDHYHSMYYTQDNCLFNVITTANDTILATADGVHELHLRKKP